MQVEFYALMKNQSWIRINVVIDENASEFPSNSAHQSALKVIADGHDIANKSTVMNRTAKHQVG